MHGHAALDQRIHSRGIGETRQSLELCCFWEASAEFRGPSNGFRPESLP
jgi:hypothetical protein